MTTDTFIPPTYLRDYAKARGWTQVAEAVADRLYVMNHVAYAPRQLVFPMDTTVSDYRDAVEAVVDTLAHLERRTKDAVRESLAESADDAIAFRMDASGPSEGYLPLAFATDAMEGARQMLLASACTVVRPRAHHPRLRNTEAKQFIDAVRFRHTQRGSFVLNVSCPVSALDVQAPLAFAEADSDVPFVRRAVLVLRRSATELVSAIETGTLDALVDTLKSSDAPTVSSNFCEALTRFEDSALKCSLELGVTWASSIARPPGDALRSTVRIDHSYFARIEEVRRELRASEKHVEDAFIGTVERLDGDMDADGNRSGEVVLSLLLPEGEQVHARTHLNAKDYARAART